MSAHTRSGNLANLRMNLSGRVIHLRASDAIKVLRDDEQIKTSTLRIRLSGKGPRVWEESQAVHIRDGLRQGFFNYKMICFFYLNKRYSSLYIVKHVYK